MTADPTKLDAILPAIAQAMAGVKRIAKTGRNEHDKYNFASIDAFLEAVNPICADAGLIIHMQETKREEFSRKGKFSDTSWLAFEFVVTVYHISGQSLPPVLRSVEVVRSGAQASGSAQSYALKQFLRSLLLIPTGDADEADNKAAEYGPVKQKESKTRQPVDRRDVQDPFIPERLGDDFTPPDEPGLTQGVKGVVTPPNATDAEKAGAYAKGIIEQFKAAKTTQGLDGVWGRNEKVIARLQEAYPTEYNNVLDAYGARLRQVEMAGAA